MRSRVRTGSVVQDKRDKVWRFYWWENGKRRSKVLGKFPTKVAAWSAAKPLRDDLERGAEPSAPIVSSLIERYRAERMPTRTDTRRSYEVWIRNHILPRWGECVITDLAAAAGGAVACVSRARTKEQGAHSGSAQHPLGLRRLAR